MLVQSDCEKWLNRAFRFEHWVSALAQFILCCLSAYTAYVAYGAVWAPTYVCVVSFLLLLTTLFGRRALRKGNETAIFVYGALVYVLTFTLMVLLAFVLINVGKGINYVQQNWYLLQNLVLPFTTEADTESSLSSNAHWVFGVGCIVLILLLPLLVRVWYQLGGSAQSGKPATSIAMLFVCVSLNCALIAVTVFSLQISSFSSSTGPSSQLAVLGGGALLGLSCIVAGGFIVFGKNAWAAYFVCIAICLPTALLTGAGGAALWIQATAVPGYVSKNSYFINLVISSFYRGVGLKAYSLDAQAALHASAAFALLSSLSNIVVCIVWLAAMRYLRREAAKQTGSRYSTDRAVRSGNGNSPAPTPRDLEEQPFVATPAPPSPGVSLRPTHKSDEVHEVDPASLLVQTPKALPPLCKGALHFVCEHRIWCGLSLLAFIATTIGLGVGSSHLQGSAVCGRVAGSPATAHFNTSFDANFVQGIYVKHSYPFGVSTVFMPSTNDNQALLAVDLTMVGLTKEALQAQYPGQTNPLVTSVVYNNNDNTLSIDLAPYDLDAAVANCVAAALVVTLPSEVFGVTLIMDTAGATTNLTSHSSSSFPIFQTIKLESDSGPVFAKDVSALADISAVSNTGRVSVDGFIGSNIYLETSNDLIARNTSSFAFIGTLLTNLTLVTTGEGNIIISEVFVAFNASATTENGDIIGVVSGAVLEQDLRFSSINGDIYLSDFLQAAGSQTHISTVSGEIRVVAFTGNWLNVTTATGSIYLYEVFLGSVKPSTTPASVYYPPPALYATASASSITALGVGATPTSTTFPSMLHMYFHAQDAMKIEVNGGGFSGAYSVSAPQGTTQVSVGYENVGSTGYVEFGYGFVDCLSDTGNVVLAFLPGPLDS